MKLSRRQLGFAVVSQLVACKRDRSSSERCPHCGMLIDTKSAFRAELTKPGGGVAAYDTPRCALAALRAGAPAGSVLRVQEFYSRAPVDANLVRFVAGSDVEGPMGAELVPVAPDKVDKFVADHHGSRARTYTLDQITRDVLKREGAP